MSHVSGFTHVLKSRAQHWFSVKKALERVLVFQVEVNIDKVPENTAQPVGPPPTPPHPLKLAKKTDPLDI